jgi:hypothetical protein
MCIGFVQEPNLKFHIRSLSRSVSFAEQKKVSRTFNHANIDSMVSFQFVYFARTHVNHFELLIRFVKMSMHILYYARVFVLKLSKKTINKKDKKQKQSYQKNKKKKKTNNLFNLLQSFWKRKFRKAHDC